MSEGDQLRAMLAALRRLLKAPPANTVRLRRRLADEAAARGGYPFYAWSPASARLGPATVHSSSAETIALLSQMCRVLKGSR